MGSFLLTLIIVCLFLVVAALKGLADSLVDIARHLGTIAQAIASRRAG